MNRERIERLKYLRNEINKLPSGSIFPKQINGNTYYYHQWSESGIKHISYVKVADLPKLVELIEKRKQLQLELHFLKKGINIQGVTTYILMHKNIPLIELFIDSENGHITSVGKIYNQEYLPIGTIIGGELSYKLLSEWWSNRSIPLTRSGIKKFMSDLSIDNTQVLLLRCYGLSLSDQYWIKPKDKSLLWEEINFFDNAFSEDVGELLLNNKKSAVNLDLSSPDNTSIGNLKKKWKISNGKRILIKGGSEPFRQEPYNEVIASKIASLLDIPCVDYSFLFDKDYPYCECENFIDRTKDFVPAYQINKVLKKSNNDSNYTHFVKCCKYLGISNVENFLNKMLVFDFIIANEDRHLNNFGFIRDADALEFLDASLLFDNGASFGFNKLPFDIKAFANIEAKPFKEDHLEQLKYVTSFNWLNKDKLEKVKKVATEYFFENESKYIDKKRINRIIEALSERIDFLLTKI